MKHKLFFLVYIAAIIFSGVYLHYVTIESQSPSKITEPKSIVIAMSENTENLIKGTVISGNHEFEVGDEVTISYVGTPWHLFTDGNKLIVTYNNSLGNVIMASKILNAELHV